MDKRRKMAIEYLQKDREIQVQMLKEINNYMNPKDKNYKKIKQGIIDRINAIDYILMRI